MTVTKRIKRWMTHSVVEESGQPVTAETTASVGLFRQGTKSPKKQMERALPFPVILPQRRPGTKTRGFVRAYAPVLQDAGIDQGTLLTLLKDSQQTVQASPIFDVILVAMPFESAYLDRLIGLGIQAVQVAVGIGQEIQGRWRTNETLDQGNKETFIPQGMYALTAYMPGNQDQAQVEYQTVDLGASAFVRYGWFLTPSGSAPKQSEEEYKPTKLEDITEKMKQLRIASAKTQGETNMPATCAELIFSALDAFSGKPSDKTENDLKRKAKDTSKFVQN